MPVYRHETYDYGPTFRLGELMSQPERIRAAALATQGQIGAEAERARGAIGAGSMRDIGAIGAQKWATLGQLTSQAFQNVGQYYADKPKREAEALNLKAGRMELAEANRKTSMRDAVRMILSAPGLMVQDPQTGVSMYDKQKLSQELTAARLDPSAIADVLKTADALDGHAREFVTARREAVAALAFEVLQAGSTPLSVAGAVATGLRNGAFTERDVQPFLQQIDKQGPDAIFPLMRRLTVGSAYEEQASKILSPAEARSQRTKEQLDLMKAESALRPKEPGTTVMETTRGGVSGHEVVPEVVGTFRPSPPPAEKTTAQPGIGSFEDYVLRRFGGQPTPAQIEDARRSYQLPSGLTQLDAQKFKKAAPILDAIAELSERINTNQGVYAKLRGGAAKLAAKANLDDDVAEYDALVMGFTPLVARALGHTGVLTEQDVVSTRMLFPKPGESKSLRDRKIARLRTIVTQLEDVMPGGSQPLAKDVPDLTGLTPGKGAKFTTGPFAGQTWTIGPDGQPKRVR